MPALHRLTHSICALSLLGTGALLAQRTARPLTPAPDRVISAIDDTRTVRRAGTRPVMARSELRIGAAAGDHRMESMILVLQPDEERQSALEALLAAQQDPGSPHFRQWLTPEEFGARFGVSENDLQQVTRWLESHGFTVDETPAGRTSVVFSGTAAQVERAFHSTIGRYSVDGQTHYANDADVEIPAALAGVVQGVVSMHDFRLQPLHSRRGGEVPAPMLTSGSAHYLSPGDFATIYDANLLLGAGIDGAGQSIAVVGRTNIQLSDVTMFRAKMGLPVNDPTVVLNGRDPGLISSGEVTEALLDVQWAGAVARQAAVRFVVSASTSSSDGVSLSAQYIVARNLAPVMTISFGACEAAMGSAGNQFWNSLFQQAAAQGITALVASGDSGAAGCDASGASTATRGRGVNALCSSPHSVCVGGTQFSDTATPALYWSATNSASYSSALTYIPETTWNESAASGGTALWSTGGGASSVYAKPAWQAGPGVPADGRRDVPDVSLTAAGHVGYLIVQDGKFAAIGGTSAAAPALASAMALVAQKNAARLGNPNPTFYSLASLQAQGGAPVFHDIKSGSNSVPGVAGYAAGPGYDMATGLGSVDVYQLASRWKDLTAGPGFAVSAPNAASLVAGSSDTAVVQVTLTRGFSAPVVLTAGGLPSGLTAAFAPATLPAPGAGGSVLSLTGARTLTAGTYQVVVTATAAGQTRVAVLSLTVINPVLALALPADVTLGQGAQATVPVSIVGTLTSAMTMSVTGLPPGVAAAISPALIAAGVNGKSILTFTASSAALAGKWTVTVLLTGGGVTKSATLQLNVSPAPLTLSLSPASLTIVRGGAAGKTLLGITPPTSGSVQVSISGVPANVTPQLQIGSMTAAAWQVSVSLTARATARAGSATVLLTVTSGTTVRSVPLQLTIQ